MSSFILGVVNSAPFQMSKMEGPLTTAHSATASAVAIEK
jgi:hypothetical protein